MSQSSGGHVLQWRSGFSTLADAVLAGATASVGAALYASFCRWNKRQEALVQSGAAASCSELLCNFGGRCPSSRILKSPSGDVEYVLKYSPPQKCQVKAFPEEQSANNIFHSGEVLFFFHGGLGGSDQLLASGFTPPAAISHIFLPNRFGYFRSHTPLSWLGYPPVGMRGPTSRKITEEDLRKNRLRLQAKAFRSVLQCILDVQQSLACAPLNRRCHLLAIGEGCAHAVVFANLFPEMTKTVSLIDPVFGFNDEPKGRPLARHVMWRLQMHQRLMKHLPSGALMPALPPPKLGFLEWVGECFASRWPAVASEVMVNAVLQNRHASSAFVAKALQQAREVGWSGVYQGTESGGVANETAQHRELVRRLQCLTGTCFLSHRMPGFVQDVAMLAPWGTKITADKNAGPPNSTQCPPSVAAWLIDCLADLKAPVLLVHSNLYRGRGNPSFKNMGVSEVLHLTDAHPHMLLFTHGQHLKCALERLILKAN